MKLRFRLGVAFLLVVQISVAQKRQQPLLQPAPTFDNIFDSLIIHDSTIPVFEYKDSFPTLVRDSLVYDLQKSYCGREKELLDNPYYTDQEKIRYLKNAFTHSCDYCCMEEKVIQFFKKNNEARQAMDTLFSKARCALSDDPEIYYRHFNFVIRNTLPGSIELIEEYIKNRPTLKVKHRYEDELVYGLIMAGREKEALNFLQVLINEFTSGKLERFYPGSRLRNENTLDLLCFSKDSTIQSEAKKLLWAYLNYETDSDLFKLAWKLDEKNTLLLLQKWFQYYAITDLGKMDSSAQKVGCYGVRMGTRKLWTYMRFMEGCSPMLGKTAGKQVLTELIARLPYWKFYRGIKYFNEVEAILRNALTDSSLTENERKQMIEDLRKADDYQNPVRYPQPGTANNYDMAEVVADLKQLGLANIQLVPDLPDYWCFKWSLEDFEESYNSVFEQTAVCQVEPGIEGYQELFEKHFKFLLGLKGITDIVVKESYTKITKGYFHQVFMRSREAACKKEFTTNGNGSYDASVGLVKMINLLLIKKGVNERLIEITHNEMYVEPTVEYGLFEPEKLYQFLSKYNRPCPDLKKVATLLDCTPGD